MLWSSLFWKMTCIGVARTEEILKNTDLSVFWCCLGFVGGCVHACRGGSNRGGGGLFHHIGRHLFLWKYPRKIQENTVHRCNGEFEGCFLISCFKEYPRPQGGKDPEMWIKCKSVSARRRSGSRSEQERSQNLSVGLSACGLYLYLSLHANGSCETSQTFFPTVTFHQSEPETRGPREDGSWSAPSHWLFGCRSWRPMARVPGWGHSQGNCLQSSIITAFTY